MNISKRWFVSTSAISFFGWIASLGPDAVIASPDDVRDRYREFLEKSLSNYK